MQDNEITIIGNMVTDPERRRLDSGAVLTRFRVASTLRRLDRESGQWRDVGSTYLSVSCWRRLAEHAADTLRKGDPVVVIGRLAGREWERDGQRRYGYELEASMVALDLNRASADVHRRSADAEAPAAFTEDRVESTEDAVATAA